MRILVTGTEGQVARALVERAAGQPDLSVVLFGRPALDLARPDEIAAALRAAEADLIVNAAAYTAVDKAEGEPDLAMRVNAEGAGAVAAAAAARGIPVVQLSTDYVFDGTKASGYREADPVGPTSAYGSSKLAGEAAVLAANPDAAVLRTAWVYSPFGANFAKTMLRLAADREEVGVVADQFGAPTSALDIADGVLRVARNLVAEPGRTELRGVFHMTAVGRASWADFAEAVFEESRVLGGPFARVRRIATVDYPTPARRPANSQLDSGEIARVHGVVLPFWRDAVRPIVARLVNETNRKV